jgi:DNA-binding NarL/FixJ family response regulator
METAGRTFFQTFPHMPVRNILVWIDILRRNCDMVADGFFGPIPDDARESFRETSRALSKLQKSIYASFVVPARAPEGVASDNGTPRLSSREIEIVRLIAGGYRNSEIAKQLNFGLGTIKSHVRDILEKLGATSRTEAASIAMRKGII